MASFNLIRKRRRRVPIKLVGGLLVAVGLVAVGIMLFLKYGQGATGPKGSDVEVAFIDRSALSNFSTGDGERVLEYVAMDEQGRSFPHGANVSFTVLSQSTASGSIKLDNIGIEIRSFVPLAKIDPSPDYEPPILKDEINPVDEDVAVELAGDADGGITGTITWSAQAFETGDGARAARASNGTGGQVLTLVPASIATPLSSINKPDTRIFVAKIVLTTPGKAEVALRADYDVEGRKGAASTADTVTLVYVPDSDYGSLAFQKKNFEARPSFERARAYRDVLLAMSQQEQALQVAQDYRRGDPGADADWLVGDTLRTMGEYQRATGEGLWAFYKQDKEFSGDRLQRWNEVKDWLTKMVQDGVVKLPGQ